MDNSFCICGKSQTAGLDKTGNGWMHECRGVEMESRRPLTHRETDEGGKKGVVERNMSFLLCMFENTYTI